MNNHSLIVHQFALSPFSEKLRLILGYKGIQWRAVEVPMTMPKPDVVALTGGHRRTPFMQIGADVYCDTALCARVLERLQPEPTLYPARAPLAEQLAQWADFQFFWVAIPYGGQPAAAAARFAGWSQEAIANLAADRAAFGSTIRRPSPQHARGQLLRHCTALERQLADGRTWLFGDEASIADFSVAHCLWFIRTAAPVAGVLTQFERLSTWLDQVLAIGHGQVERIDSAQALREAASATTHVTTAVQADQGFEPSAHVTVAATDYGLEAVTGTLVGLDDEEVVIRRQDERAGVVHVHFPRAGFEVKAAK